VKQPNAAATTFPPPDPRAVIWRSRPSSPAEQPRPGRRDWRRTQVRRRPRAPPGRNTLRPPPAPLRCAAGGPSPRNRSRSSVFTSESMTHRAGIASPWPPPRLHGRPASSSEDCARSALHGFPTANPKISGNGRTEPAARRVGCAEPGDGAVVIQAAGSKVIL
jgi:hypothetical protein